MNNLLDEMMSFRLDLLDVSLEPPPFRLRLPDTMDLPVPDMMFFWLDVAVSDMFFRLDLLDEARVLPPSEPHHTRRCFAVGLTWALPVSNILFFWLDLCDTGLHRRLGPPETPLMEDRGTVFPWKLFDRWDNPFFSAKDTDFRSFLLRLPID